MNSFLENFFKLKENRTTVKTEVLAGITTFMTMAYILIVNPSILSETGMDKGAIFTATAVSSFIATCVMAIYANYPFALAPGMGLNAYFAYTIVIGKGLSWQFALTAVLLEGIVFILLTLTKVREAIVNSIPLSLKNAVSAGIGLFIAFLGLYQSGLVVVGQGVPLALGDLFSPVSLLTLFGIIVTIVLVYKNVPGGILLGMVITTILAIPLKVTSLPHSLVGLPSSISPIFFKFEFNSIFTFNMLVAIFAFLFVDLFDTVGTLVGVASKADMLDENGNLPKARQALFADAIGTTAGAVLGTSTVTTFVESASGVAQGGRTGLTALTTAVLFLIALVFEPIFSIIPSCATASALIVVGLFMISNISKVDFNDFTDGLPSFLAIIMMPLTYSIANGIVFGIVSYVIIKVLTGKHRQVSIVMYILAILFVIRYIVEAII